MNNRYPIRKSTKRTAGQPVALSDAECLIMWPKGSVGERNERLLLITLLGLADEHGYGRVTQLAEQIQDLWMNPENHAKYNKLKADHLARMKLVSKNNADYR